MLESTNILEFILNNKNKFEKRKYFKINNNFEIEKKEPSFILELAYIYFEKKDEKIKKVIENEFLETFLDKNKKIERLSKIEKEKLIDSFKRAILNCEKVHSIKLGKELLYRDKYEFFKILYNISLISVDENKLIKTYFIEKMLEKINLRENKEQVDEIIKNIINYFTKSEIGFIDFYTENSVKYFIENKVGAVYKKIYNENFDIIINKYNIKIKKIQFDDFYDFEKLSESKKILFNNK